jgi:hypothetical protein
MNCDDARLLSIGKMTEAVSIKLSDSAMRVQVRRTESLLPTVSSGYNCHRTCFQYDDSARRSPSCTSTARAQLFEGGHWFIIDAFAPNHLESTSNQPE